MVNKQIPVTVIGGYLGAGKTTLLNHILRNNKGIRFAVLVNDFGNINIDVDLIESQDGDTINLANGCICCSLAGGFGTAMLSIRDRPVLPDRVLIEASGVSDPFKIAQYAHLPGFRLDSVIVLADAEFIQKRAADKYVGRQVIQQLKSADLLLLNKVDLVSDEKLTQVREWLHDLVPDIRILEVSQGQVPVDMLFGEKLPEDLANPETLEDLVDDKQSEKHEHHHDHDYVTWSYIGSSPLDGTKFRALIAGLDAGILRGKGFLYLAEDPSAQFVFQLVGKRWSIEKGMAWENREPKTQFVLIGLAGSLDGVALDEDMQNKVLK
ncbi:GTP-binding protein [Methyloglobulus sp.]|uniref:CobW family GTP-binding protein n=1 Tax=Methyloglobulus sp. TaxID=2518622 RepID=UPI0032B77078